MPSAHNPVQPPARSKACRTQGKKRWTRGAPEDVAGQGGEQRQQHGAAAGPRQKQHAHLFARHDPSLTCFITSASRQHLHVLLRTLSSTPAPVSACTAAGPASLILCVKQFSSQRKRVTAQPPKAKRHARGAKQPFQGAAFCQKGATDSQKYLSAQPSRLRMSA